MPRKETSRNNGIKAGERSVRFSSGSHHYGPDLQSETNLLEILGVCQRPLWCFVDLEKAYDRVARDKVCKVLQEYGIEGQDTLKIFENQNALKICTVWNNGAWCMETAPSDS